MYLNELRHKKSTALKLSFSVHDENLPAARVVRGEQGFNEGTDYWGVSVFALGQQIQDSPWYIVAKVDKEEVLAPLTAILVNTSIIGGLALCVLISLLVMWWVAYDRRMVLAWSSEQLARKKVEDGLQESDRRAGAIFDNAAVGMSITTPDGHATMNKAFCEMLGYTKDELSHIKWQELTHADDIETAQSIVGSLLAGKENSARFTKRYLKKNGDSIWTDVSTVLQRDKDCKPLYFITSVLDITVRRQAEEILKQGLATAEASRRTLLSVVEDQKRTEETLRQSEDKFSKAFMTSPYAITITRAQDGGFVEVNDAFTTIAGISREEALADSSIGLNLWVNEEDRQRVVDDLRAGRAVAGHEYEFRTKSGKIITALFCAQVVTLSSGPCILSSINDISERKRAESDLRIKNQVFEDSIASQSVADSNGAITHVNAAFLRMWGYATREQALGNNVGSFFANPADAVPVLDALAARDAWEGEFLARRVDGTTFNSRGFATSLRTAQGELAGYQATNLDVTREKDAEQDITRLNRELLLKNAELEQVVYVASHDLRSPLVNVQGFCKELAGSLLDLTQRIGKADIGGDVAKSIAPIIATDIPESLGYIQTSVARMDALLSGLLRLSRLGRAATSIVVLDIDKILTEVLKNFEYTCKHKGAEIRVDAPLPCCHGDQAQMNQVLSNLVDNALKYLDPSRPGRIIVSGNRQDDNAVYCVADNGIGIAPQHCEKAFEIFHRLNPNSGEGEGLGLTIVRRSLDKQGGRVWVESELGKGSRFFVSLPGA